MIVKMNGFNNLYAERFFFYLREVFCLHRNVSSKFYSNDINTIEMHWILNGLEEHTFGQFQIFQLL